VFEELDRLAGPNCIFATNTSTMSPTEIGSFTSRPEKVAAMHFFNPVHKMPLVEIIKGLETNEETGKMIRETAERMGKETVLVNEFPGFVTSRISALVGNEAFYMLQEGIGTPEEIDKAVKLGLNYPMGPFELADLVGLDTRLHNLHYLHQTLGEKYRPAPLLIQYVKAGRLGKKTGRGVYDYNQ
jgi:3-hydroxybutyryl-CoA dehydrogenase